MSIANEAAYLYVFSKELLKINRKLKKASKQVEKKFKEFKKASKQEAQLKAQIKYQEALDEVQKLQKEHNLIIATLRKHQTAFTHALQKQHKL